MLSTMLAAATLVTGGDDGHTNSKFVVQTLLATAPSGRSFRACLTKTEMPRWRRLQQRGVLVSNAIYEKVGDLNELPGPDWSHVVVTEMKAEADARPIFEGSGRCEEIAATDRTALHLA
jgi:hypothetical protein